MLRKTTYSDADQHRMRRRIILSNARKQRFQQVEKHQNSSNSFIGPISTAQIRNRRKMILTATRNRNSEFSAYSTSSSSSLSSSSSSSSYSIFSTSSFAPPIHNHEVLLNNVHQINNDFDDEHAIFEGAGNLYDIDIDDNELSKMVIPKKRGTLQNFLLMLVRTMQL